ncbi:prolyl oligopeptidase family serine peptidase [Trueperella bernardiae]|uniref:prolyl oligopeptidase family serine peptidase n=1 Tax=Trueperella bernardiae TaxID=59561 RepID=UPI00294A7271|nr:prolyl oligopeptidase family serine peptidase [Trueperella bernardiae]MDV6239552.1 prolyl oligopeptidase family serine peptidase [Trueperella bernardiae]
MSQKISQRDQICEGIVQLRGKIRLPGGRIFYPHWKTVGASPIYGGYVEACEALVCDTSESGVVCHVAGEAFPLGHHIEPLNFSNDQLYVHASSFIEPPSVYQIDRHSGQLTVVHDGNCNKVREFTCRRVWDISDDGTLIPIDCFGTASNTPKPTIVHVYGGFGRSNHSFYNHAADAHWLKHGYTIAVVHSRGGGEYGDSWHQAGVKEGRRQVKADIAAAIRALHQASLCTPETTIVHGMSHGAIVAAATTICYPELISHIVCRVPISSTQDLATTRLGMQWIGEYGDPRTNDWSAFMKNEDPIACDVTPGRLEGTSWLVVGYCGDTVTDIAHADLLAERAEALGGRVTYWRYPSNGGHHGALDPVDRLLHERKLWRYLNHQASGMNLESVCTTC